MNGAFKLAWRYILYHRGRSIILMCCIFLTLVLPVCLGILLRQFSRQIVSRAEATPVVVGAKGSQLDLALHAIYFSRAPETFLTYAEAESVGDSGLATPIPLHVKYSAQGFPVVGTSLQYFRYRGLSIDRGESLAMLGDCVVGFSVAKELGVGPGDQILSDRGNVLDLAGEYPLKLNVVGVLSKTDTADDKAVFADLKTVWVIQGLGHGHQDLEQPENESAIIGQDGNRIVASAAVLPYTEITESNMSSFHFHGEVSSFPISAVIVDAPDVKSQTILEGRYRSGDGESQLVRPPDEIRELMALVFQVKQFFDANAILVAIATLALLALVVMLSLKLRAREMETMFRLGCSKGTMFWIQVSELGIVFLLALCLVFVASTVVWTYADEVVQQCLNVSG